MGFADAERADLAASLDQVGPGAPTLCEGWTTDDLLAHVWVRENDALAGPGMVVPALAELTASRMKGALDRWGYTGLLELFRSGPSKLSPMAVSAVDEQANTVEYFVHTEDVRRPNGLPRRPRTPAFEDMAWRRLRLMAGTSFRRAPVGVVLERTSGETIRARKGARFVTVVGDAAELVLFAFGRTKDADVRLIGTNESIDALRSARLGP